MHIKWLFIVAAIGWTVTHHAMQNELNKFAHITQSKKSIFDDPAMIRSLIESKGVVNASIDYALKTNKSDTLQNLFTHIKLTAEKICNDLSLFSTNLSAITLNPTKLNEFRESAKRFSKHRD